MLTILDVIRHLYAQTSQGIHDIKRDERRFETREKFSYVSPDGTQFSAERVEGWKYKRAQVPTLVSTISPRNGRWAEYRAAKSRAHLLSCCILILKANDAEVPASKHVALKLANAGVLDSQAPKAGRARGMAGSAYRTLAKLGNRLEKQPERFGATEEWKARRQAEYEERKEAVVVAG